MKPAKGEGLKFDVYLHPDDTTIAKLDQILAELKTIKREGSKVSAELEELTASVANNTTVTDSAVTLLNGLGARIEQLAAEVAAGGGDPAALTALAQELNTNASELAAAIEANTDAAPHPDQTLPGDL